MLAHPVVNRPFAILSDIHGNLPALEAVLAELARRAVVDVYALGDHLLGGADPHGVWQRLVQVRATLVRGVSDTALATMDPRAVEKRATSPEERTKLGEFLRTREALGELVLARLRKLPDQVRLPLLDGSEAVLVHGAPADASIDMSHDLDDEELSALLGDDPADLVLCGGSHVPFQRQLGPVRIVNVGSVGAAPEGKAAHFTVATPRSDGTLVEQAWVELDA